MRHALSFASFVAATVLVALAASALRAPAAPSPDAKPDADANATDAPAPLRVATFNIRYGTANDGENRWELRQDLLLRTIRAMDPDLLGVQEALDFQTDWLREQMPEYSFFGAGRDDGKRAGEFSAVYYRTDRFEKLDEGHFWLSETPDVPGSKSWDAALTRMATWVKLRDRKAPADGNETGGNDNGGRDLLFINTHWDHRGEGARLESAKLMRRKIRELAGDGPVVFVGDFNATEDEPPYAELLKPEDKGGPTLFDAYRLAHPTRDGDESTFHGFKGGAGDRRRIDWVLHTPHFETERAEIDQTHEDNRYPSDHYAVSAMLRWKASAPAQK